MVRFDGLQSRVLVVWLDAILGAYLLFIPSPFDQNGKSLPKVSVD